MKLIHAALALALLAPVTSMAQKKDAEEVISEYGGKTSIDLYICKMAFKLATLSAQIGKPVPENGDWEGCITKSKSNTKPMLNRAIASTKKAAAKAALKAYHVAYLTALDGIRPGMDELARNYEARQQALEGKTDEAWNRVQVEL